MTPLLSKFNSLFPLGFLLAEPIRLEVKGKTIDDFKHIVATLDELTPFKRINFVDQVAEGKLRGVHIYIGDFRHLFVGFVAGFGKGAHKESTLWITDHTPVSEPLNKLLWSTCTVMRKEVMPDTSHAYQFNKRHLESILANLPKTLRVSRTTPYHYEVLHQYSLLSVGMDVVGDMVMVTV